MRVHHTSRSHRDQWPCWAALATLICLLSGRPAAAQDDEAPPETPLYPLAVATTDDGPIYIADLHLPGIWKLEEGDATIFFRGTRRFGTPLNRVRCLAIDHEGRLLAGDSATRDVYRFSEDGKPEPLTGGMIGTPAELAVGAEGRIFVSDLETQRIWSFPTDGLSNDDRPREVALAAGVRGLAFDGDDKLVLATTRENPIRRVEAAGDLKTLVEGRPFEFSHQIAIADDGTMFVTDNYAATVWTIPAGGGKPEPLAQGDPLVKPVGLARKGKSLIVADPHARAIFKITPEGEVTPLLK